MAGTMSGNLIDEHERLVSTNARQLTAAARVDDTLQAQVAAAFTTARCGAQRLDAVAEIDGPGGAAPSPTRDCAC
ncbi:hypothetical protein DVS77_07165 [Mycolicibacterium moriokaense]|nr:hypothetical protein DVS77_07165 [Mycolicibacterium moriokaense]